MFRPKWCIHGALAGDKLLLWSVLVEYPSASAFHTSTSLFPLSSWIGPSPESESRNDPRSHEVRFYRLEALGLMQNPISQKGTSNPSNVLGIKSNQGDLKRSNCSRSSLVPS